MKTDKLKNELNLINMVKPVMIRVHVLISGKVQGVFFRSETKREAEKLGIKGWICNLPNGRVEAVFEGEETCVKRLLDYCRRGSCGAKVEKIDAVVENYTNEFSGFEIIY